MSLEIDLRQFIEAEIVPDAGSEPIRDTDPLISTGRVDSIGLVQIVDYVHTHYGVDLTSESEPKDFESIASLAAAIRRIKPAL